MSNSDLAGRDASTPPDQPAAAEPTPEDHRVAEGAATDSAATDSAATDQAAGGELADEPTFVESEVEVGLERSVRFSRLLIVGAIVGVVVLTMISLSFPVTEESQFTMPQVVGFMALVGAVLGLTLGGVLGLVLSAIAKRQRGTGTATQVDVR